MANWSGLLDRSWQRVEITFAEQMYKTPPMSRPAVLVPLAPRKPLLPRRLFPNATLKPRRLEFEMEAPPPTSQDSGVSLWSSSSAAFGSDEADKENRPLPRNTRKKHARTRKGAPKPEFRPMRI